VSGLWTPTSTAGKLVQQARTANCLKPRYDRCGRKRSITGKAEKDLERHIREYPDATLQERKDALELACTVKTVWLSMQRLKARLKKSQRAAEQD